MTCLLLVPIKELANATLRPIVSLSWIVLVMVFAVPALARTWTDSSGTHKIEGEFVTLTDGKVDIRSDDGTVVHVPLEKLSEPDQKYVQKATSDRKRSRFLEAEGSGATSDEALKDAFRAAVRSAVGAYVDEETQVENDEVITDQVLTHSRGCIDSYEKLSEKFADGVTRVTIRAVVKPDEVVSCLRKANVTMTDLSGEQFWAKVTSKRQEEKDAESLLRKALEGFPENCLKAEPVGEPRQDHSETVTRLGITVRLAVDPSAYQTFSKELQRVLDQIARKKHRPESITTFQRNPKSELPILHWQPHAEPSVHHSTSSSSSSEEFILALLGPYHPSTPHRGSSHKKHISKGRGTSASSNPTHSSLPPHSVPPKYSLDADVGEDIVVASNTLAANSGTKLNWKCYQLDKRLRPLLTEAASRRVSCRVMLVDAAGSEVAANEISSAVNFRSVASKTKKSRAAEDFPVTLFHSYHDTRGKTQELRVVLVSQVFFSAASLTAQLPELRYESVFDLADARLRSVKQTRCKLSTIHADDDTN